MIMRLFIFLAKIIYSLHAELDITLTPNARRKSSRRKNSPLLSFSPSRAPDSSVPRPLHFLISWQPRPNSAHWHL